MDIGGIKITIDADDSKASKTLEKMRDGFKKVGAELQDIGKKLTLVGGAVTAVFAKGFKDFIDFNDHIAKMSDKTGVAISTLQKLNYAGNLAGVSLEEVAVALKTSQRAIGEMEQGSKTYNASLQQLGLTQQQLFSMNSEQQFMAIANAISGLPTQTQKASKAIEFFGKSGTQLLPMLKEGKEGLKGLMGEFSKYGVVVGDDVVRGSERFKDTLTRIKTSVNGLFSLLSSAFLPIMQAMAEKIRDVVKASLDYYKANRNFVNGLAALVLGVGGLVLVVGTLTLAISTLVAVSSPITFTIIGIVAAIAVVSSAIYVLYTQWDKVWNNIKVITKTVVDWIHKAFLVAIDGILSAFERIPFVGKSFGEMRKEIKAKIDEIKDDAGELYSVKEIIGNAFDFSAIRDKFKDMMPSVEQQQEQALQIASIWDTAFNQIALNVKTQAEFVVEAINGIQSALSSGLSQAFIDMLDSGKSFGEAMKDIFKGLRNSLIKTLSDMLAQMLVQRGIALVKEKILAKQSIATDAAAGAAKAGSSSGYLGFGAIAVAAAVFAALIAFASKFAKGGIVGGTSWSGDNVLARVNSGEMILSKSQQARLWGMVNGDSGNTKSSSVGSTVNINQNIEIEQGENGIESITKAIKRGTIEALDLANAAYRAGRKQNGLAV